MKKNVRLVLQDTIKKHLTARNQDEMDAVAKKTADMLLRYFQLLHEINKGQKLEITNL